MAGPVTDGKLLRNLEEILEYCGISEALFREFHANGLPARRIGPRWFAHKSNIDEYFRILTKASPKGCGRGPQGK